MPCCPQLTLQPEVVTMWAVAGIHNKSVHCVGQRSNTGIFETYELINIHSSHLQFAPACFCI